MVDIMKKIIKIIFDFLLQEKNTPDNSGSKCACKHYPTDCTYCHNMIAEHFGH
jgi:hypothetical protein